MLMLVDAKYRIGDMVYLVTDPEQTAYIITRIQILPGGTLIYFLNNNATNESCHYDIEITKEKSYANL